MMTRSCSRTDTHEPHHWDYPGVGIHHDYYDCPGFVTGQDPSDPRDGSTGRVGGHVRVAGYVPSAEAVEAAWSGYIDDGSGEYDAEALRAGLLAAVTDPDLYAAMKRGLSAAVPVEVARLLGEVRALADRWELMAEQHTSPVARVNIGKRADELRAVLDTVGVPAQVEKGWCNFCGQEARMDSECAAEGDVTPYTPAQVDEAATCATRYPEEGLAEPCVRSKGHDGDHRSVALTNGGEVTWVDEAATGGQP